MSAEVPPERAKNAQSAAPGTNGLSTARPTEDPRAESSLKRRALQTAIFNSVHFSNVATDEKGVIQLFSPGAESMLGYQATEVIGRITPADFSDPQELISRARGLTLELGTTIAPGFEALVCKAARGHEDVYELICRRKDGSRVPMVVSVTALRNVDGGVIGYLLVSTDNTARKRTEETLRRAEADFRLMVGSVTDCAMVMLDSAGIIVSWNAGAELVHGYSAADVVGRHFSVLHAPEDIERGAAQAHLSAAAADGRFEDEGWRVRKNGSTFWASVVITAIRDPEGNARGFAKLTRDLTRRREDEAILMRAKEAAESANLAKSDFVSSMSHELRSPLNAILGFAQLMESDSTPITPSQKENISEILRAGWYLLDLVNEILDLAQIESGKLSMSNEPTSPAEVFVECRAMLEPQAQARGIQLTFPRLEASRNVLADRTRLKQVLINLLSNAIKYNRPGGAVLVGCSLRGTDRVRISVKDSGAGLAKDEIAQLFQPFNRLGQALGPVQGTGIGLVMAKRLVELMGGVLGVESTLGVGSTFWFELKLVAASELAPETVPSSGLAESQAPGSGRKRTILYVEDNPANLRLVEKLIGRRTSLRLLSAPDGDVGVALARARQPDLVLMDINLPGISGIEALAILREGPTTAHIPVVALSANAMPHDIERGLKAGFFAYLSKPIKVREFMETVDAALEFSRSSADRAINSSPS